MRTKAFALAAFAVFLAVSPLQSGARFMMQEDDAGLVEAGGSEDYRFADGFGAKIQFYEKLFMAQLAREKEGAAK